MARRRTMGVAVALVALALSWSSGAKADGAAEAARLYDQATRALERRDFAAAASDYARADQLSPHAAALQAALLAVLETDDATLGMELAARAARAPKDDDLAQLATKARVKFSDRVGRIFVRCSDCDEVLVDERVAKAGVAIFVRPGAHDVILGMGAQRESQTVNVAVEGLVTVEPRDLRAPPPAVEAPPPPAGETTDRAPAGESDAAAGASPAWFWVGLVLTGGAVAGTIASGVDLGAKHADFQRDPNPDTADRGKTAQTRTHVLIGVSAGLVVATTLVGALAVDWSVGEEAERVSLGIGYGHAHLRLRF